MNKQRRKELLAIADKAEDLKTALEGLCDEEQSYYDNMPESIQGSERGQNTESAIEHIAAAHEAADEIIGAIQQAVE
jgi:hypothetical protein